MRHNGNGDLPSVLSCTDGWISSLNQSTRHPESNETCSVSVTDSIVLSSSRSGPGATSLAMTFVDRPVTSCISIPAIEVTTERRAGGTSDGRSYINKAEWLRSHFGLGYLDQFSRP